MNARERFHAIMNFQPYDRLPILEWASWWDKTILRWREEGLPESVKSRYELYTHFGIDQYKQDWFSIVSPECPKPKAHGSGIIESEADYDKLLPYLFPKTSVDGKKWRQWAKDQQDGNAVLWFTVDGFFWFARRLLGIEPHLYAFYDQPKLMHRINSDLADWMLLVIDQVCEYCTPDFMTFGEDMSYNNGPMLSKEFFDEFMLPYYHRVVPVLKSKGILPIIDSDGDITIPAYWFAEAGLEGILPLERQAGVNIATLRANHPKMKFIGHFDKMTMDKGEARMREEFERLLPTAIKGGFLISCDHQTPPGVSYSNYLLYLKLFKEYAEKAGEMSRGRLLVIS